MIERALAIGGEVQDEVVTDFDELLATKLKVSLS